MISRTHIQNGKHALLCLQFVYLSMSIKFCQCWGNSYCDEQDSYI